MTIPPLAVEHSGNEPGVFLLARALSSFLENQPRFGNALIGIVGQTRRANENRLLPTTKLNAWRGNVRELQNTTLERAVNSIGLMD